MKVKVLLGCDFSRRCEVFLNLPLRHFDEQASPIGEAGDGGRGSGETGRVALGEQRLPFRDGLSGHAVF